MHVRLRLLTVLALAVLATPVAARQEKIGAFVLTETLDEMTDVLNVMAGAPAEGARDAMLVWRCTGPSLELLLATGEYLGSQSRPVMFRFDAGEPSRPEAWSISTTGRAVFSPRQRVASFTTDALAASRVVIRVSDFRRVDHTYRFDLTGLSEVLDRLPCWPNS